MTCPNCGKQVADIAKFCDGCGCSIETRDNNAAQETVNPEQHPDKSGSDKNSKGFFKNKFNIFAAVLTLVLAIVLIVVIAVKPKSEKPGASTMNVSISNSSALNKSISSSKQFLSAQSWQEMSFMLDGVEYKLPLDISELEKHGWTLDYDDEKVEPGNCINFSANNELSYIKGTLCNFSNSKTDSKNCKIRSVCFNWANGIFPQDIIILSSGIADVFNAYGDADYFDEYNKSYIWGDRTGYLGGNGAYIKFYFDSEDIVSYAELGCEINQEG